MPVGQLDVRSVSNLTRTFLSACSDTSSTVPTRMPAIRTVSPDFSRDASLKTAEYPFVEPVLVWPKTKNRNAVSTTITSPKAVNLMSVLGRARHPGCPICAVLRGGPSSGPNSQFLSASEFSRMPWFPYCAGFEPTSPAMNGGTKFGGRSGRPSTSQ